MTDSHRWKNVISIVRDLTLLIVGVLTALAAENWREDRAAADEARVIASLLVAELEQDYRNIEQVYAYLPRRDTAAANLLTRLSTDRIPGDSVLDNLWTLRFHMGYAPSRATFDRLMQSDGLQYIGTPQLQREIISYFQELQGLLFEYYQYFNRHQDAFAEASFPYVDITPSTFEQALGPQSRMDHRLLEPWNVIRQDSKLTNRIWYITAASRILARQIERTKEANLVLRESLATELR